MYSVISFKYYEVEEEMLELIQIFLQAEKDSGLTINLFAIKSRRNNKFTGKFPGRNSFCDLVFYLMPRFLQTKIYFKCQTILVDRLRKLFSITSHYCAQPDSTY